MDGNTEDRSGLSGADQQLARVQRLTTPRRGRTEGRRRAVVAVSMPLYDLDALDAIAAQLTAWRGRKVSRSEATRRLIEVGTKILAGHSVDRL